LGTKYTTNPTSGYNATPPPDGGETTEANKVKWSTIKTKLSDPPKDRGDSIDSDLLLHFDRGPVAISTTTTIAATHFNEFLELTGTITLTMTDASTLASGWFCDLVNADTNVKTVARATSTDTINGTTANVTIPSLGALRIFVNTATNGFRTVALDRTPMNTRGDIEYRDANGPARLAVGAANQVLTADGTDISWGAVPLATDAVTGGAKVAAQSVMEGGTANDKMVTPGRFQYHPGASKSWLNFNGTGTVATRATHNIDGTTPLVDNGTGNYTVNWATDFSSVDYAVALSANEEDSLADTYAVGSIVIKTYNTSGTLIDVSTICASAFGDQ
jgi:hypothetical protein